MKTSTVKTRKSTETTSRILTSLMKRIRRHQTPKDFDSLNDISRTSKSRTTRTRMLAKS